MDSPGGGGPSGLLSQARNVVRESSEYFGADPRPGKERLTVLADPLPAQQVKTALESRIGIAGDLAHRPRETGSQGRAGRPRLREPRPAPSKRSKTTSRRWWVVPAIV